MIDVKTRKYQWTHIYNPSDIDIEKLHKKYDFHELILEDLEEFTYENSVDLYDDTIALALNFPKFNSQTKKYVLNPFYLIVGKTYILSFSKYKSHNIDNLSEIAKKNLLDDEEEDTGFDLLYEILNVMYDKTIKGIRKASNTISKLQEKLLNSKDIDEYYLQNVMIKKLNMIALKHMFMPQMEIIKELDYLLKKLHGINTHEKEDYGLYLDDLDSKLDKIIGTTERLYETLKSLGDTYDSFLAKKTNIHLNVLTIFTAILGVLTLIVGAYGMNVRLPGQENPYSFWVLFIFMILIIIGMYKYFRFKKMV